MFPKCLDLVEVKNKLDITSKLSLPRIGFLSSVYNRKNPLSIFVLPRLLLKLEKCGWVYAGFGIKKTCPSGTVAAGFCGVANTADCANQSFVGMKCCPP